MSPRVASFTVVFQQPSRGWSRRSPVGRTRRRLGVDVRATEEETRRRKRRKRRNRRGQQQQQQRREGKITTTSDKRVPAHRCALGRAIEENPVGVDRFRRFARERLEKNEKYSAKRSRFVSRDVLGVSAEFRGKRHRHPEKCAIIRSLFVIHNSTIRIKSY